MTTIAQYLRGASNANARRDREVLLAAVLGVGRAHLYAHGDDEIAQPLAAKIDSGLRALTAGTPVAYVVGQQEFWSLTLDVGPDVLIPRPDTELAVELALQRLRPGARVLDVGTGSGAIALAIKHARPDCAVVAIDVSPAAVDVARRNAAKLALDVDVRVGDWFDSLHDESFDVIVSNPPYVRAGDPHLHKLVGEPRLALVGGPDGLAALRVVVRDALEWLAPSGVLIVEHGYDQGAAVRALFEAESYRSIETYRDAAGHERATLGSR